jgi:hypothetical protein
MRGSEPTGSTERIGALLLILSPVAGALAGVAQALIVVGPSPIAFSKYGVAPWMAVMGAAVGMSVGFSLVVSRRLVIRVAWALGLSISVGVLYWQLMAMLTGGFAIEFVEFVQEPRLLLSGGLPVTAAILVGEAHYLRGHPLWRSALVLAGSSAVSAMVPWFCFAGDYHQCFLPPASRWGEQREASLLIESLSSGAIFGILQWAAVTAVGGMSRRPAGEVAEAGGS